MTDTLDLRTAVDEHAERYNDAVYDQQTARVAIDYDSGGSGTMTIRWRDGQVDDLTIAFRS